MSSQSPESRVHETLMTMDVVDRIRQRDSELQALANSGANDALMRERLSALYRAQGIDVSNEIIARGIEAQREKRFQYRAPKGVAAAAARAWIARRRVAAAAMIALASMGAITGAVTVKRQMEQASEGREVVQLHEEIARIRAKQQEDLLKIKLADEAFWILSERTAHPPLSGRLDATVRRLQGEVTRSKGKVMATTTRPPFPQIGRVDGLVVLANSPATGAAAISAARRQLDVVAADGVGLASVHQAIDNAREELLQAIGVAEGLTAANTTAMAAHLPDQQERIRKVELAAGEAALVRDDISSARRSANIIGGLADAVAAASQARQRAESLRQEALATGAAGEDLTAFEQQYQRVLALIGSGDIPSLKNEMTALSDLTHELGLDYELRIVSGDGRRSGVWRHNKSSPDAKNYYLIVEAIPRAGGSAIPMSIRNEENGNTETVSMFGIRVAEAEYERVRRDKTDNGVIDVPLIGSKPRGKLTRSFSVPVSGGYITRW